MWCGTPSATTRAARGILDAIIARQVQIQSSGSVPELPPLTVEIYVGGTLWMNDRCPGGVTVCRGERGQLAGAAEIPADTNIRVDVTTVGTTEPGKDMSVHIYG